MGYRAVVDSAREHNIPIRIGVNGGSLERDLQEKYGEPTPEALLESAMRHVDILRRLQSLKCIGSKCKLLWLSQVFVS